MSGPDFENPPVTEVVLGVFFEEIPGLDLFKIIGFGDTVVDAYPNGSQLSPIAVPTETLDGPMLATPQEPVLHPGAPPARLRFSDSVGTRYLQLQQGFFACCWARGDDPALQDEPYPRYPVVREGFEHNYARFSDYLRSKDLEQVAAQQCEVTYVNHITPGELWTTHANMGNVVRLFGQAGDRRLPPAEHANVEASYLITDSDGVPRGRLRAVIQSGYRSVDFTPAIVVTMTARVLPLATETADLLECLDIGHDWVVNGFVDVTTDEAHKFWQLHDQ